MRFVDALLAPLRQHVLLGALCRRELASRYRDSFLGNLWMYTVRSPLGELLVSAVNDGGPACEIGQAVGLDWQDRNVRVIGTRDTAAREVPA